MQLFGLAEHNTGGNLILALAQAAKAVAETEVEKQATVAVEESDDGHVDHCSPDARLASVLEINRLLLGTLAEKKGLLAESQDEIKNYQTLLDRSGVEEPARRAYIEELQARVQNTEPSGRNGREARLMARDIEKMEAKIGKVNENNLILSDRHRVERARMVEQQARLRTLGKRERELAKHLDYLATQLNEIVANKENPEASEQQDSQASEHPGHQPPSPENLPSDFRNLPGMRLNKLVGIRDPPQVRRSVSRATSQAPTELAEATEAIDGIAPAEGAPVIVEAGYEGKAVEASDVTAVVSQAQASIEAEEDNASVEVPANGAA